MAVLYKHVAPPVLPGNSIKALQDTDASFKQIVRIDGLTGIGNRRAFEERLDIEWRRQRSILRPLSVLICDVDLFKYYNKFYGQPAGDVCLRRIARAVSDTFQFATEFSVRYAGTEFAAILVNTDLQAARRRAETLRANVRALAIDHAALGFGADMHVTVSVGVASRVPDLVGNYNALVDSARRALHRAKRSGRNCVELELPRNGPDAARSVLRTGPRSI